MISLVCTKKKPMPEAKAEKLYPPPSLFLVYHPDAVCTRHEAANQSGDSVGVFWTHACPHCKEKWRSQGVVSHETLRQMERA